MTPEGEIRLAQGSYQEATQKLQLEFKEDPGSDRFLMEGPPGDAAVEKKTSDEQSSVKEKLPGGFSVK